MTRALVNWWHALHHRAYYSRPAFLMRWLTGKRTAYQRRNGATVYYLVPPGLWHRP